MLCTISYKQNEYIERNLLSKPENENLRFNTLQEIRFWNRRNVKVFSVIFNTFRNEININVVMNDLIPAIPGTIPDTP